MRERENLSLKERRELYKAMLSAHSGICPQCGVDITSGPGFKGCRCHGCDFRLNSHEVVEIRSWHQDFYRNLPAVLSRWREE